MWRLSCFADVMHSSSYVRHRTIYSDDVTSSEIQYSCIDCCLIKWFCSHREVILYLRFNIDWKFNWKFCIYVSHILVGRRVSKLSAFPLPPFVSIPFKHHKRVVTSDERRHNYRVTLRAFAEASTTIAVASETQNRGNYWLNEGEGVRLGRRRCGYVFCVLLRR